MARQHETHASFAQGKCVLRRTDNDVAKHVIMKRVAKADALDSFMNEIREADEAQDALTTAMYTPGKQNVVADSG